MSNSIWKTPDQKPEERRQILFYAGCGGLLNKGWYYSKNDAFGSYSSKNVQKWAYVDELFAQADKAERLEQAVQYLKRLHIKTIEKYNPKEKELAEQTIDCAIEIAIKQQQTTDKGGVNEIDRSNIQAPKKHHQDR